MARFEKRWLPGRGPRQSITIEEVQKSRLAIGDEIVSLTKSFYVSLHHKYPDHRVPVMTEVLYTGYDRMRAFFRKEPSNLNWWKSDTVVFPTCTATCDRIVSHAALHVEGNTPQTLIVVELNPHIFITTGICVSIPPVILEFP